MGQRRLNIGLIGAGRIGKLHAEHLCRRIPRARLAAISDANMEAAQDCAERLGIPRTDQNYHDLLADPAIEAVVICSPTDLHAIMIEEAAQAGKHIFCEKPIARTLPEIDQALHAVEHAGVKLQIGFNRRFDANFARIRHAIVAGEIGQPQLLHIISRDPGPPPIEYIRSSGGMFLDMTIHDFDMARFLIGGDVEEVYAAGAVKVDFAIGEAGDIDTAIVMLKFANGVLATIDNSRRAVYGYDQRVEAFGSGGAISVSNNHPNTAVISDAACVWRELPLNFFMDRYTESFLVEMAAFVSAILDDTAPLVSGIDGRAAVQLAAAAQRAYAENRPVLLRELDTE